ncbi:hypothetical protein NDR87_36545 [Nocardia sp. CDC159]|uniref:Uncharacterized protein n=1 Tax=Nocardia pulmonis TaxID=2951408 RepID=A0A9X2J0B9_9NOCA|nr:MULTISPECIES: hypothetical protein [Nocardia]MCM6779017.1 hypothetical protein [Nocardia pulmonis]MCM6791887.1 hypothetical protein [Nocardia sp. CDC159]
MIVIIGLVILVAAVLIGVTGVFANSGGNHVLTDNFAVFGYHVTGSTGVLFLYGIVVGGVGIAGLGLLLAGARRTARRGRDARRELEATRHSTPTYYSHTGTTEVAPEAPGVVAGQEAGTGPAPRRRGLDRLFGHTPAAR